MQVSLRDVMIPHAGHAATATEFAASLREIGLNAIELWVEADRTLPNFRRDDNTPHSIADAQSLAALRDDLNRHDISPVALCIASDYSDEDREGQKQWSIDTIRAAQQLGAPTVRIDTATRQNHLSSDVIRENFIVSIREILAATQDSGIDLGIENHGVQSNDPQFLRAIFAAVPDSRLGLTLDTGNFYWFGFPLEELYQILAEFAPRARHTHVKNIAYPTEMRDVQRAPGWEYERYVSSLSDGDIDIARVVGILQEAGYNRSMCIEDEAFGHYPPDERFKVLCDDAEALRAAIEATK